MAIEKSNLFPSLSTCFLLLALGLTFILHLSPSMVEAQSPRKEYIIYMGSHLPSSLSPKSFYDKMMRDIIGSEYGKSPSKYLLYTYQRSFYGCVARLTAAEAQRIKGMQGVVSVFPNTNYKLHTTRSWDFLGFPINVQRSCIESDVIIGVIDTGITPESFSFNDAGLGPVPTKWKGICQSSHDFFCNKKIIGARFYRADQMFPPQEGPTARDFIGHGTHTASTIAGALVPKASLSGLAFGTARGGVPSARIAVYKVCWSDGKCSDHDILAAFDDAIADGVDIISASLGNPDGPEDYFQDPLAIGAFHANRHGILSSLSAGNKGPSPKTVVNVAPWLMSVAANTIDRKIVTHVKLANGKIFQGVSINTFDLHGKNFPLIYAGDAANSSLRNQARFCIKGSLNKTLVQGKIVLCDIVDVPSLAAEVVLNQIAATEGSLAAGAVGTIMQGTGTKDVDESFRLPASFLGLNEGSVILSYIRNKISNPKGTIFKSNDGKDNLAPVVASFSSRGPNPITPGILKPDLSAPGVEILAAFSPLASQSGIAGDKRSLYFNIESGTSMSCPHASAAAAYVKSFHPDWTPAMIRSALMTTASDLMSDLNPEGTFAYGAGQIDPRKAVDPGLVYELTDDDYVKFLCSQGYTLNQIRQVTNSSVTCPYMTTPVEDLNYPSFSVVAKTQHWKKTFHRTVTNVATGKYCNSTYKAKITPAKGVTIKVIPSVLQFNLTGEKQSFQVVATGTSNIRSTSTIEFSNGTHRLKNKVGVNDG